MGDDRVSVERVRFGDYETRVEELLAEYHESVADRFREWLSRRVDRDERSGETDDSQFTPATYVDGELKKDLAYLEANESRRPLVVALDGDSVVGCVYLYDLSAGSGEVKRLYVRDEYRGIGLGRRLMEALIEYADRDGYSMLRLDTAPFMDNARGLYGELGFEPFDGGESISDVPAPLLEKLTFMKLCLGSGR